MDRPRRLALIELLHRDGRPLQAVEVHAWPFTLGRALDSDLVLDDPHVAARHAQLQRAEDGTVVLHLGETINGAELGSRHLQAGESATLDPATGSFQLGQTRLRLRLPEQALVAERPLSARSRPLRAHATLVLLLAVLVFWPAWLRADPGQNMSEWLPLLLGFPVAVALWCLLWALATKLFQHRFEFWGHLGVLLRVLVPVLLIDLLLPQVAASLNLPWLWQSSQWLTPAALVLLLWRHALLVVSGRPWPLAAGAAALLALGVAPTMVKNERQFERLNASPYMATLPLPAWRFHQTTSVNELLDAAKALEPALKARVEAARKESGAEGGDDAE